MTWKNFWFESSELKEVLVCIAYDHDRCDNVEVDEDEEVLAPPDFKRSFNSKCFIINFYSDVQKLV